MPEYLDDPSVLTKDKLKSELLAHNVELPSGNPPKDVFVQLYLKELTSQNVRHIPASLDGFSSDEDLPPPVVSSKSRSSGRKSTIRGEKVLLGELDVTVLDDQSLREELLSHGLDAGPIVASTRKLYEKKLQKLLDSDSTPSEVILPDTKVTSNGSTDPGLYSDQDDGSCLKVEKIAASEQTVGLEKDDVQKELPPSDLSSPTGITPVFAAPLAAQTKAASRSPFPWTKLLVLALLAALFFFVYQTMEPNSINPFDVVGVGGPSDGKA
ncbi:unnamed protein product [Tetraodon nigroviridis]|uniref:(spotted green pufferfish) hypothetical protein n=1 Tax=Tetraodon nigroviridis TaxID=99883 RepID=Q4SRH7_TETNG|nr:unnamed protein product [Tetraodon nigroviridis]